MTRPGSVAQRGGATVLALWLALVGGMAAWITAQRATDRVRMGWHDAYPLLFLPNGRYLQYASLGFEVVLADLIYLWSIQYYGYGRTLEARQYLWHIYSTISDLDPQFIDAYTTGAMVMAQDMRDPALALRLLERGIERNPDNWLLPVDAGWYSYTSLDDLEAAERYFAMAASKPGAPPWAARLRAHMVAEQGDLLAAIAFWEQALAESEEAGDEYGAGIARQRVPDLYAQWAMGELEAAIDRFVARQGRRPESLAVLARLGLLPPEMLVDEELRPLNYELEPFGYDPATGEIADPSASRARSSR
jgi:tetratricopeptide (TPR) repeat protein